VKAETKCRETDALTVLENKREMPRNADRVRRACCSWTELSRCMLLVDMVARDPSEKLLPVMIAHEGMPLAHISYKLIAPWPWLRRDLLVLRKRRGSSKGKVDGGRTGEPVSCNGFDDATIKGREARRKTKKWTV
jgi:hypothetical protein